MNRKKFINYIKENFNVSIEFLRLLDNVLSYAELKNLNAEEICNYLNFVLDCGIGITKKEIKQIIF